MVHISKARGLAAGSVQGLRCGRSLGGKRWRLIDLHIGHAVKCGESGIPSFSLKEARVYLNDVREDRWEHE